MTDKRSDCGMFMNIRSFGGGDIEQGSNNEHVRYIEQKASPTETSIDKKIGGENMAENVSEIDKWVGSLRSVLEDVPHYMCTPGHPGRVSRIPKNLLEVHAKSYEPYCLSIGPYHHGKPRLRHMEKRKQLTLKCVLKAIPELTLKDYLKEIKSIEPLTRSFYSDMDMESQKFLQMMLLDGVYIVTTFCGMPNSHRLNHINAVSRSIVDNEDANNQTNNDMENKDSENANMMMRCDELNDEARSGESNDDPPRWESNEDPPRWFWSLLVHDLFLLENQLPFFVLQKIHNLIFRDSEAKLLDIVKIDIVNMLSNYTKVESEVVISPTEEAHHLLHICHEFFCPTLEDDTTSSQLSGTNQMFRLGSAMQLYEAGVTFEASSPSLCHTLLDIKVGNHGKMVMPCLYVDENIESLLRNLIALEQMKYPHLGLDVSAYVVLLLHLITTPGDVALLRRKGVIQHHLPSDKEMMYFVNRLSVGLSFDYIEDRYSLKPVFQELKRYTERSVPRWRAWLKHRHFRNPWTVISLMAAALLLFLTVLQTFYTVYSYYHPYFSNNL